MRLVEQPLTRRQFCTETVAASVVTLVGFESYATTPHKAKPFVKWAGGKGQLLTQLTALLPADLDICEDLTYVEPFVGGGAMVFYMLARYPNLKHVIINDLNKDLINAYTIVRDAPGELIAALIKLQTAYYECANEEERKAYYLKQRTLYNQRSSSAIDTAAQFIFLNRTCFNGLYRVNAKGAFNVPFGKTDKPLICDKDTILADSALLQKVEIVAGDFEGVYKHIKGQAFIYFDPPYRPLPKTPSFTAYSKEGFNDDQQKRLATFCRKLDSAGHRWLLSNSDPTNTDPTDKFFEDIFHGFDIQKVYASRMINSKGNGRGKITELAIRNYRR